jgi:mRNA interferase MazF
MRPAVCLTNAIGQHKHVVLAFITSQIPADILESDIIIETSHKDFKTTGLRVSSTIRLHRTLTVTTSLIKRELGKLSPNLQNEMDKKLKLLFEL